jgi:hypothetical protein
MGSLTKVLIAGMALAPLMSLAQAPNQDQRSATIQPEAWQIVLLANHARAATGAAPLQWDPALAEAAKQHCLRMAAEGPISHRAGGEADVAERAGRAGAHFSLIEENVAMGYSPASIHDGWMRSPAHRSNLLNPDVDRVGVAIVASRGMLYAVADYERAVPALTQAQVEASVSSLLRNHGIKLLSERSNARASCIQEKLAESAGRTGFLMLWQGSEFTRLPSALTGRIATGRYHEAAVGSCAPQNAENWFSAYRVAVLLY